MFSNKVNLLCKKTDNYLLSLTTQQPDRYNSVSVKIKRSAIYLLIG